MTSNEELKTILMDIQQDIKSTKNYVGQLSEDVKTLKSSDEKILLELKIYKNKCTILEKNNNELTEKVNTLDKSFETLMIREKFGNVIMHNVKDSIEGKKDTIQTVLKIFIMQQTLTLKRKI